MKLIVLGTRGIPDILGGVETHCEELYPRIYKFGIKDIILIRRKSYVTKFNNPASYKGIKLKTIYSPKSKSFEAIVHSFLGVLYAAIKRPDVLHIHAIGPSLVVPLARLVGLKVVMTHHGPDYQRKKWGVFAKAFLRAGEWAGVKFANKVIVISSEIGSLISEKYNRKDLELIPNGVPKEERAVNTDYLDSLNIGAFKYIFALGRFVPEKGFDYLVEAYVKSGLSQQYKLVIAGDADHETAYSRNFKKLAAENAVILPGFVKGEPLKQLFSNARLFVLPSFYEGLPIALLEAMNFGLDIVCSDIKANLEVKLDNSNYFKVGNVNSLIDSLKKKTNGPSRFVHYDMENYNWDNIALKTIEVYKSLQKA